jgi:hypothetical protein
LGDQEKKPFPTIRFFQGRYRPVPADEKREDHIGEEDEVAKGNHRELFWNFDLVVDPAKCGHSVAR